MAQPSRTERVDAVRRKLLKSSLVAGGFLAAGHVPYSKPAVKSFFGVRTAWAQPSGPLTAQFLGSLPDLGGGAGTGQDAWEFDTTQPNTNLTINVMVTGGGPATAEIGLFAPGIQTIGVNLLTGVPGGYNGALPVAIAVAAVGTYTLAVEDSLINAAQLPFSYQLDVTADMPIVPGGQVITDGPETLLRTGNDSS
jgi:hypothetical protein